MPTQLCLVVAIAGIIVVAVVIGSVTCQEAGSGAISGDSEVPQAIFTTAASSEPLPTEQTTFLAPDVTSKEAIASSSDLVHVVSTLLTTSPGSFVLAPSLSQNSSTTITVTTTEIATQRTATTPPLLAPTLFTSIAQTSSSDQIPSVVSQRVTSTAVLSTSVSSSSLVFLSLTTTVPTSVTTLAIRSPTVSKPSIPEATGIMSMPDSTLSSSMNLPTETPDTVATTATQSPGTDGPGNDSETSFWLYVAIPVGSATFCAIFLLFACLICIWCKRMIKIKAEAASKREEEGDPRDMFVLENASSKGSSLRYDIPGESTKTFAVTSLTAQSSERTPTILVTTNQPISVSDGSDKKHLRTGVVVANPSLEWSPEVNTYYSRMNRGNSLPRSYQLGTNQSTRPESLNPPVMMEPARSLSSVNTRDCEGKRKPLSSALFGSNNTPSKVCAAPTTTDELKDQQIGSSEELKHTQRPRRTNSANALHTNAELATRTLQENEGLYDVPRAALFRRASDSAHRRNAVAAKIQSQQTDSEPSSYYDTPRQAIAREKHLREILQQHPPNTQSSEDHTSSSVTTSSSFSHYDVPKKVQASHSFSSKGKYRVNPQTSIQRHPTHPKAEPMPIFPNAPIPRTQAVAGSFSTYDVPRKAATLPHSHADVQGDTSHYDIPRRLTAQESGFRGMMHGGPEPGPGRVVYTMPRVGDRGDVQRVHLPTSQKEFVLQSADDSAHGYHTIYRPPADIDDEDSDSSCGSEHLYDQPPPEFLEELRLMAEKKQTSNGAAVVLHVPPQSDVVASKSVGTSVNPHTLQKMPPPTKQKPVSRSTATKRS